MEKNINWVILEDAFGEAGRIPELLNSAFTENNWEEAWTRLCHQETIYSASYAATIFIVHALESGETVSLDSLLLPTCIELSRHSGNGALLPQELENDYFTSVKKLGEISKNYIDDPILNKASKAMCLVTEGNYEEAEALLDVE